MWLVAALATFNSWGAEQMLPNVVALPASDIQLNLDPFGNPVLEFATTSWNAGAGALEVVGGETGQDKKGRNRQNVYQTVYLDDGSSYQRLVGSFVWHPEHNHFHVEDYATYSLQKDGAKGKSKRTSTKTSFCLIDTDLIDGSLPGAPTSATYLDCDATTQGISVGWADVYGAHLPGQEISVSGLETADYRLTMEFDPKNRILESNDNDNTSCVLLHIDVVNLHLTILNPDNCDAVDPPSGGDVEVAGITPDVGARGTILSVTISGSGFAGSPTVLFTGGSGPAPTVSDVTVVDGNTITAVVTIKNGGGTNDLTWDLSVDGSTLQDAFTVEP